MPLPELLLFLKIFLQKIQCKLFGPLYISGNIRVTQITTNSPPMSHIRELFNDKFIPKYLVRYSTRLQTVTDSSLCHEQLWSYNLAQNLGLISTDKGNEFVMRWMHADTTADVAKPTEVDNWKAAPTSAYNIIHVENIEIMICNTYEPN